MRKRTSRAGGGRWPLLAGGLAVLVTASGCSLDIFNPGAITDEALNDASLMDVVAAGVANEFNQLSDNFGLDILRLSDEAAGNGSYFQTGRLRRGAMDWDETGGMWGQIHETVWTGLAAWERMGHEDVVAGGFDRDTSADAARVWLMIGHAHRFYGETYCQVVYSYGEDLDDTEDEFGDVQAREVAFDEAIAALNQAIAIGTAAGADDHVTAARAGLAQAYVGKGDFATAITHSAQVPTDFEYMAIHNQNANSNLVRVETIGRHEVGVFNAYASNMRGGGHDPAAPTALEGGQDPRVPYTICALFDDPATPFNSDVTPTGLCNSQTGADGVTAQYQQQKYPENESDIPIATGREMRLIEAEAALLDGDLPAFTDLINEVRDFYGLDPIAAPASVGALEYTNGLYELHNAYDASLGNVGDPGVDGWSILDAERQLTLWGEGRRLFDLHRWDHPFLDGGIVFWDTEPRRVSCYPVPEIECRLNTNMREQAATLLTGVGAGTQTCM